MATTNSPEVQRAELAIERYIGKSLASPDVIAIALSNLAQKFQEQVKAQSEKK